MITKSKFQLFHTLIEKEKASHAPYGSALLALWICNALFVAVAWLTVYIEPLSSGSGRISY
jgi:UDP-N-acetylmuramyl pentapeptide phosphotransferase/UDP-N-acetylglucosamine-1-phosphate transferase